MRRKAAEPGTKKPVPAAAVAAPSRRRDPKALEPTKRDADGLKIVSSHSGSRQHLGLAPMHRVAKNRAEARAIMEKLG